MNDAAFVWLAAHPRTTDVIGRIADGADLAVLCGLGVLSVYMLAR